MSDEKTLVDFLRVPLTTPCPVLVEPGTGRTMNDDDEPLPLEVRTELCAVDAGWMVGSQRVCDFHLRQLFDAGFFEGTFESLIAEAFPPGEYGPGAAQAAIERSKVPWGERKRYSQEEAQRFAEEPLALVWDAEGTAWGPRG